MQVIEVKKYKLLIALLVAFLAVVLISGRAHAIGNVFPDNTSPCDFDVCANDVQLYTSNTSNVKILTTVAAAYFTTANPTLRIYSPDLCSGYGQNDVDPGMANGDNVTNFTFAGGSATPSSFMGEKRSAPSVCSSANNYKDITFTGVPRDPITGRYIVTITATHQSGAGGAQNAFKLGAISGGTISFKGAPSSTGTFYNVGMVQNGNLIPPNYLDYIVKFGSDETVTNAAGQQAYIKWYDIDQAPSPAQGSSTDVTMELYEMRAGASSFSRVNVVINASNDASCTGLTNTRSTWTPNPSASDKANGCALFRAYPGAKYEWRVYNVYNNNMIQLAVPFDGACYVLDCTPATPPAVLTPTVLGANSINRGSSATFTLHDNVTNYDGTRHDYTYNVNYSFDGGAYTALPNSANIAGSNIYSVRNRTLSVLSNLDRDISPVITFNPTALIGHNRVCIEFRIANGDGMTVSGNPGVKCTDIIDTGQYTISVTANDHEKGSGDKTITGTLSTTNGPCNPAALAGTNAATVAWRITGPGVNITTTSTVQNCNNVIIGATLTATVPGATLDGLGAGGSATYTPSVTGYTGISPTVPPTLNPATIKVYTVPYAIFAGNDIYACGGGSTATDGKIIFNTSNTNSNLGASVEYAALALSGFNDGVPANITTAFGHGGANALRGNLANNSTTPCGFDVSTFKPASTSPFSGPNLPAAAGFYESAGSTTISGTTTKKVTVYVNGNITISSNGVGASGSPAVPFVDNDDVPYVLLIATGNIYIAPGVTSINAVLIANGTISTCSTGGSLTTPATSALIAGCGNALTVNGAMQANNILFRRSPGTRLLGDTPAERIVFPPYMHFATPNLEDTSKSGYQALFNAPPYL